MLSPDIGTYKNLNRLEAVVRERKRPLVIWVGAGVSTWAGYPLWNELAAKMHSEFSRSEPRYDALEGAGLLANGLLPQLFYNISESNLTRYLAALSAEFQPKEVSPLYDRLIQALLKLKRLHLLTTNIDESLERRLPNATLLQRSDFEGVPGLLASGSPFICKLHGSVSSIKSAVFTSSDYQALITDSTYLKLLREIFSTANVLFLGYSVRDEYVLRTLLDAVGERVLFGAGEHFVVCTEGANMPSDHLRPIRYVVDEKSDHRTSLLAVELAAAASESDTVVSDLKKTDSNEVDGVVDRRSTYFLADLLPFGTWNTSQLIRFRGEDSVEREMVIGEGYIRGEVETSGYSPMHDIVVGLLCFDTIGVSLASIVKLHSILGSELFWQLVSEDIIRVVHSTEQTGLVYETPGEWSGGNLWDLQTIATGSHLAEPVPMSVGELIRRQLQSATGDERQVTDLLAKLESKVTTTPRGQVSNAVRSTLAHPSIRKLLGVSLGTPATRIPRWVAYPVLRLASVITTGEFCRHLDASATRMLWGSERLAGAAFSAASAQNWTDDAASYALAGRFNMDLGALVQRAPDAIKGVLAFRRTPAGDRFRAEIHELLAINEAGELSLAINSGLRQAIAPAILEQARDQLSGLFVPRQQEAKIMPAVFGDLRNGETRIARWRARSREMLKTACAELKVQPYDACPCGSGEKLKFCCFDALRS